MPATHSFGSHLLLLNILIAEAIGIYWAGRLAQISLDDFSEIFEFIRSILASFALGTGARHDGHPSDLRCLVT